MILFAGLNTQQVRPASLQTQNIGLLDMKIENILYQNLKIFRNNIG